MVCQSFIKHTFSIKTSNHTSVYLSTVFKGKRMSMQKDACKSSLELYSLYSNEWIEILWYIHTVEI